MQYGAIILLLQVVCVVHAAKTGRFWPWGYVVIFLPGFGALAYVLIELLPEWFGSVQGQKTRSRVVSTLDPGKRYRALTDQLQVADTIATRADLAEECLTLGKYQEALGHYEHILSLPMGDDAVYAYGKARALSAVPRTPSRPSTTCGSAGRTTNQPTHICSMPACSRQPTGPTKRSPNTRWWRTIIRAPKPASAMVLCSTRPRARPC